MMNNPFTNALVFLLKEHARLGDGPGSQQAEQHLNAVEAAIADEQPSEPKGETTEAEGETQQPPAGAQTE